MTIDDFWEKYNRCPLCRSYPTQGSACNGCKWYYREAAGTDKYYPSDEAIRTMNREVTSW